MAYADECCEGHGPAGGHIEGSPSHQVGSLWEGPVGQVQVVGKPHENEEHFILLGQIDEVERQGPRYLPVWMNIIRKAMLAGSPRPSAKVYRL